jgi:hypothetical protein
MIIYSWFISEMPKVILIERQLKAFPPFIFLAYVFQISMHFLEDNVNADLLVAIIQLS